ncbi:carbamoyl phosphate synthase small subunit [Burkholderia pseudomallei]|nr:carbamoyl phosphate synthase small subunit [Burkholderia pseudomallei]OMW21300.1 carbamoyl phosphate synthase small subunit [Burkholderia pseudomallei]OMY93343.1 carbamoyl phosphate synthase small subunit [Burkholderia pseudomallei]OMY97240.1 carbamoyl phosphate synthase small subunit [Burkholderia pseudomallei]OMZ14256.1 carbamoyl phosphate synthase small subunit [Burkholderia pseudomallei]
MPRNPRPCARFALDRKPARESAHARVMRHAARERAAG